MLWIVWILLIFLVPVHAYAGVGADTLKSVGLPLVQVMVVASFGAILCYITSALGQGQISSMIKLMSIFICIGIVIGVVWGAISKVARFFGLEL